MHTERETHSEQETVLLGVEFARELSPGSVVALYGDLGSGKTHFIQGVCAGLGVTEHVASPTFAIVNEYVGRSALRIYHFDFYRLRYPRELQEIGIDDYFTGGGICHIEWADKVEYALPEERFTVRLSPGAESSSRRIIIDTFVPAP
jgi:tRNA threonylcarbamoyladenosine biosynthesis protein TsaE